MSIIKLSKYISSNDIMLIGTGIIFFLSAGLLNLHNEKPTLKLSKQDTALNINNNLLIFMSAGNKRLLTDLVWVQTLIESDIEQYKKKDLNSWLYLRFNTVSILDPRFYENYLYGGQFLAIVKDDLEGAQNIYDKGLLHYPNDYRLNFNAGFLNYYELGNYERGMRLLKKIENHPNAPVFIRSIVNKLLLATGIELEEVYQLVYHNYSVTKDEYLRRKLGRDLYAIKAEIDLTCLNNNGPNCDYRDFDNQPYIKKGKDFFSAKYFLRYKIIKKGDTKVPPEKNRINFLK